MPARIAALFGAVAVVVVVVTGVGAPAASAHSVLVAMTPADGSLVQDAPSAVVLTFDSPIQDLGDVVVVTAPSGAHVQQGVPTIVDTVVTQPLAALTEPGTYTVVYRVTSTDGHPVSRELAFAYRSRTPSAATATSASTSEAGSVPSSSTTSIGGVLAIVGAAVLASLVGWWLLRRRDLRG